MCDKMVSGIVENALEGLMLMCNFCNRFDFLGLSCFADILQQFTSFKIISQQRVP